MAEQFACRTPSCTRQVVYVSKGTPVPLGFQASPPQTVQAYLTCSDGHTHPYPVTGGATPDR